MTRSASGASAGTGRGESVTRSASGANAHLQALQGALSALEGDAERVERWGRHAADVLLGGGRLLAAGNGGSAAEAQHLTAELVGRFKQDRVPLSAIALHAETSSLTAIVNDYGPDDMFARQVQAHGRPDDVCVLLSTSGRSSNVLRAAEAARAQHMTTWALTGPLPNLLAAACDDAVGVAAQATATIQEVHLVIVHLLCAVIDAQVLAAGGLRVERAEPVGGHR